MPTELTDRGFREGEHFVGFCSEAELVEKVRYYLSHESERQEIAARGQDLVLREHTYDRRVETILETILINGEQFCAPARQWSAEEVARLYLLCYCQHHLWDCAFAQWHRLAALSRQAAWQTFPLLVKGLLKELKRGLVG